MLNENQETRKLYHSTQRQSFYSDIKTIKKKEIQPTINNPSCAGKFNFPQIFCHGYVLTLELNRTKWFVQNK